MAHTNIKLYGTLWCGDCKMTKKFFGEQRVHYEFIDVEMDKDGLAFVEKVNNGKQIIPTLASKTAPRWSNRRTLSWRPS